MYSISFITALVMAYLVGSISSAVLVARLFKLPDPRTQGSGNAGATNMLRTAGKMPALLVLIADILKGILVLLITMRWLGSNTMECGFIAFATVLGHVFPIFFGFKGGKGVATAAGSLLALSPWTFLFTALTWAGVFVAQRFVSLASIIAAVTAPIYLLIGGNYRYFVGFLLIAVLMIYKHRGNIQRLRAGQEERTTF